MSLHNFNPDRRMASEYINRISRSTIDIITVVELYMQYNLLRIRIYVLACKFVEAKRYRRLNDLCNKTAT